jgi:peptidoglycan/xylan/chitin deacetylase (PgdA/CDA1 family)
MKAPKRGQFVVSLDCEGKFGMADKISEFHHKHLTNENLCRAYRGLVELFDRYEIRATFAFVGAFIQSPEEFGRNLPLLKGHRPLERWLANFQSEYTARRYDGWFLPDALDIAASSGKHEIASHGYTHLPFDYEGVTNDLRDLELRLAVETARSRGFRLETMVFPRNGVAGVEALRRHGFIGYREFVPSPNAPPRKIANLAREFCTFEKAQDSSLRTSPDGKIVAIPSGHFLNWRHGLRKAVPSQVTVRRWKALIKSAGATGGMAHLWFHPDNLITGHRQFELLEEILTFAHHELSSGRIENLTQADYCRRFASALDQSPKPRNPEDPNERRPQ